jgi:mutator protein MutT
MTEKTRDEPPVHVQVGIGLIRRGAAFLIRRRPPGGPMPGVWEFPGGKSKPGERPDETTRRECFEETGLRVVPGRLRRVIRHCYAHDSVELYYYDCVAEDPSAEPDEASGFGWVAATELPGLEFPEANEPILHALADEFSSPVERARPSP